MGSKKSKIEKLAGLNFQQLGFSTKEIEFFENYSIDHPNPFHEIDENEFKRIYLELNPELNKETLQIITKKAFSGTYSDNKIECISFDIFLVFYIIHRSTSKDLAKNMKIFLNYKNDNCGYMTPEQATHYSKIALVYRNYRDNDVCYEQSSPAGTAQMFYYFSYDKSDDVKNNSLRGYIKIGEFIDQNFKKEYWIKKPATPNGKSILMRF